MGEIRWNIYWKVWCNISCAFGLFLSNSSQYLAPFHPWRIWSKTYVSSCKTAPYRKCPSFSRCMYLEDWKLSTFHWQAGDIRWRCTALATQTHKDRLNPTGQVRTCGCTEISGEGRGWDGMFWYGSGLRAFTCLLALALEYKNKCRTYLIKGGVGGLYMKARKIYHLFSFTLIPFTWKI